MLADTAAPVQCVNSRKSNHYLLITCATARAEADVSNVLIYCLTEGTVLGSRTWEPNIALALTDVLMMLRPV